MEKVAILKRSPEFSHRFKEKLITLYILTLRPAF